MKNKLERLGHIRNNASKKLRTNLRMLSVVYVVLFIVAMVVAIRSHTALWQVVLGFLIGIVAGLISSRMYKMSWDHHEAEVIGKIDIYGAVTLVLFIAFELNRDLIAGLFASGAAIGTISLTLIAGALYGRIIGTMNKSYVSCILKR